MTNPTAALDAAQTFLFVPAARPDRFDKAFGSGAHAIIIDLEDAVAPGDKETARDAVAAWLGEHFGGGTGIGADSAGAGATTTGPAAASAGGEDAAAASGSGGSGAPVVVRVNQADSPWWAEDVATLAAAASALAGSGTPGGCPFALMQPKCEAPETLHAIERVFAEHGVAAPYLIGLLETPAGVLRCETLAEDGTVDRFAFGNYDLALELDARVSEDERELLYARSRVALTARAFGMPGAIDGPCADFSTPGATEASAKRGRDLGFAGKLAIHPKQLPMIESEFADSAADVDWAYSLVEAAAAADGAAVNVDGKMVDAPVLKRAQRIVERNPR